MAGGNQKVTLQLTEHPDKRISSVENREKKILQTGAVIATLITLPGLGKELGGRGNPLRFMEVDRVNFEGRK